MVTKSSASQPQRTRPLLFTIGSMERLKHRPPRCDWSDANAIRSATRKTIKKKSYGVKPNRITSVSCCCVVFSRKKSPQCLWRSGEERGARSGGEEAVFSVRKGSNNRPVERKARYVFPFPRTALLMSPRRRAGEGDRCAR